MPLEVMPSPDVVTRVFMIFQGISDEDLSVWLITTAKACEDVAWWRNMISVDVERAADRDGFIPHNGYILVF